MSGCCALALTLIFNVASATANERDERITELPLATRVDSITLNDTGEGSKKILERNRADMSAKREFFNVFRGRNLAKRSFLRMRNYFRVGLRQNANETLTSRQRGSLNSQQIVKHLPINYSIAAGIPKRKRYCRKHTFPCRTGRFGGNNPKNILPIENRSILHRFRNRRPYQEVMMQPSSSKRNLERCYGLVPSRMLINSKRGRSEGGTDIQITSKIDEQSVGQSRATKERSVTRRKTRGDFNFLFAPIRTVNNPHNNDIASKMGSKNYKTRSFKHLVQKRSQIVYRPLYVPTAKPSVNDGVVPQCRIPCGAHNCGPLSTCPCRLPTNTPAPPPTTSSPIPGLAEAEAEVTATFPTRCPFYEFTDEPCPTVEFKDWCPNSTTIRSATTAISKRNVEVSLQNVHYKEVPFVEHKCINRARKGETTLAMSLENGTSHWENTATIGRLKSRVHTVHFAQSSETPVTNSLTGADTNAHSRGRKPEYGSQHGENNDVQLEPFGRTLLRTNLNLKNLLESARSHYKRMIEPRHPNSPRAC